MKAAGMIPRSTGCEDRRRLEIEDECQLPWQFEIEAGSRYLVSPRRDQMQSDLPSYGNNFGVHLRRV